MANYTLTNRALFSGAAGNNERPPAAALDPASVADAVKDHLPRLPDLVYRLLREDVLGRQPKRVRTGRRRKRLELLIAPRTVRAGEGFLGATAR